MVVIPLSDPKGLQINFLILYRNKKMAVECQAPKEVTVTDGGPVRVMDDIFTIDGIYKVISKFLHLLYAVILTETGNV